jgi:TonB-dependent SusC/RagA subfamily outer membrane receptor
MKKILLGLTLICLVILQSNAQEVVIIKQSGKDSAFKPLIVVDGVITENKEIKDISPSDIKSMNVLKGAGATEKYGQKGENGVIEISTKAKYKTVLDTSNITVTVNGDEIILNGEKVNANDPRLKKIKRINVIRTPGTPGTPETPGMPAAPPPPINKAFLGVSTKATENGAQVVEVSPESPAAKAGLKEDDIITKINKEAIDGPAALFEQIGKYKPEDKITVEFLREGKSIKKEVVLAKNKMPAIARAEALSPLDGLDSDIEVYNFDAENFNK